MFNTKNISKYVLALGVIIIVSTYSKQLKGSFENNDEDYEMIKNYLLNESPLYGYNRPKLWIHSKYELNARKWKDFHSRNSTDLNQSYLHLTIKTIINHCGEDFNICLIDDDSFSKLLPNWDIELSTIAEPMKGYYRGLGIAQLIYVYGGITIPNSFVCTKNLKPLYDSYISDNKPFVCEMINRTTDLSKSNPALQYIPAIDIMGAPKNDPVMLELIEYLKILYQNGHISNEINFKGVINNKCRDLISNEKMNKVGGEVIGVKNNQGKQILIDDLCEESFLNLHTNAVGIYIPSDEVLSRVKYAWLANINTEELLNSNIIIAKYIKASLTDTTNEYYNKTERCVVSI